MKCQACGLVNFATLTECRRCGNILSGSAQTYAGGSVAPGGYYQDPAATVGAIVQTEGVWTGPVPEPPHPINAYAYPKSTPAPISPPTSEENGPPCGVLAAIGIWALSFGSLFAVPIVLVIAYAILISSAGEPGYTRSKEGTESVILMGVVGTFIAQLLTLLVISIVLTRRKRKFYDAISWKWKGVRLGEQWVIIVVIAILIFGLEIVFGVLFKHPHETDFEKLIKSSQSVRLLLACTAVLTAPIVEEGVYRGILYPALDRAIGMWPAVMIVSGLFFGVHILQYSGSPAALLSILALSVTLTVLRAKTRALFPSFAVHTIFNAFASLAILAAGGS